MSIKITCLVENTKIDEKFTAEHGLSLYIQWQGKSFLLDTGASDAFMENAALMDVDFMKLDYVVLSHGHFDHSGGMRYLCRNKKRKFSLVLNPNFFDKKFKREGESLKYIGNDFSEEFLQAERLATIFPLADTFSLVENVYIISNVKQEVDLDGETSDFVSLQGREYVTDTFEDEQLLVIDLPKGLVVITGCGHRGIISICETVKKQLSKNIFAIVGGLHLKDSSSERIDKTVAYLKDSGVKLLALGHCTGDKVLDCLDAMGVELLRLSSGYEFEISEV